MLEICNRPSRIVYVYYIYTFLVDQFNSGLVAIYDLDLCPLHSVKHIKNV